eukprot:CAMPEP_0203894716 /NCGR_PEP_ID=MMETSP0359-20131031/37634_1 /ASSEMBLY_ACC=CAM_ASM_000338 /TAXON_ID=268821 /ORGANISM="Scrippsiella Hangoei, Strain SHTV-5" /LENGTH=149 /DNA_ID=CAMNT_0050817067 /DNA_START=35 /DNA_END=484 /DNA_ORIENTATION=-
MENFELDIDKLIDSAVGCSFPPTRCSTSASTTRFSTRAWTSEEKDSVDFILDGGSFWDSLASVPSSPVTSPESRNSDQRSPSAGHAAVSSTSSNAAARRSISAARPAGALGARGALVPRAPTGPRSSRAASKPALKYRCVHLPGASPFA